MSLYPWRAGEKITAEKLVSGVQWGLENIVATESVGSGPLFSSSYLRGFADIVFDVPYESIPTIQVTARTSVPGGTFVEATYTSVTTTGFTIVTARSNDTATNVDWLAIGRPAL